MRPSTILLSVISVTLATEASITPRIPRLGAFGVSTTFGCPLVNQELSEFALGQQGDTCRTFYNTTTYTAINVYYWVPQCLLTLYNTVDCSDNVSNQSREGSGARNWTKAKRLCVLQGVVSGLGCWNPEGGIKGYKVTVSTHYGVALENWANR